MPQLRTGKHDLIVGQLYNLFQRYNYNVASSIGNARGADVTIASGDRRVLIEVNRRWHLNAESRPKVLERHIAPGVLATVFVTTHPENLRKQLATIHPFSEYPNIFAIGEDEFLFLLPPLVIHLLGVPHQVAIAKGDSLSSNTEP